MSGVSIRCVSRCFVLSIFVSSGVNRLIKLIMFIVLISRVFNIIVSDSVVRCVNDSVRFRLCVMLLFSFISVIGCNNNNVSIILFSNCGYRCCMLF